MKITIDGHTIPVKNLETARIRDVAELQQQTGWKLQELRETIAENDAISAAVLVFLSMRSADLAMTWDEVQNLSFAELEMRTEPGDVARKKAEQKVDPSQPSGASAPDEEPQAEATAE